MTQDGSSFVSRGLAALTCIYICIALIRNSLFAGLSGDEHQFLASAALAAEGQQPYRDFAYFHMPNLVYVYALFFKLTSYPFLAARLLSGVCASALAILIYFLARKSLAGSGSLLHLLLPTTIAVVLANSPIIADGAQHVWNHTTATLSAVLAFLFFCRGVRGEISWKYLALSGFMLGFATSIRLTFAPLLLAFIVAMLFPPVKTLPGRLAGFAAFAAGGIVASVPAIYFMLTVPGRFFFGNLGYEALSVLYRQADGHTQAMTLGGKVEFLMQHLSRLDNLLVPALFLLGSFIAVMARKSGPLRFSQEVRLLLLFLPFLFFGSIAPTPSWPQYYFAPMVFLSLFSAYLLAELPGTRLARPAGVVVLLVLILSLQSGLSRFTPERISALATPSRWYPIRLHEEAVDIAGRFAEQGASGRVLTLAPAVVVEAGLPVYPEFASGRFAWRASYLMPVEERLRQAMVGPDELDAVLRREVPGAILTGEQPDLEQPLIDAARRLGFQPMALSIERTLWMR